MTIRAASRAGVRVFAAFLRSINICVVPGGLQINLRLPAAFLLVALLSFADTNPYSHDSTQKTTNTQWMTYLPDSVTLYELSIPGTHDTMTYGYQPGFGLGDLFTGQNIPTDTVPIPKDIVVSQSMNLATQLNSGIRVLDIRCKAINNQFLIYHGDFYVGASFDDVLNTVTKFLTDNPGETVLMRVTNENAGPPLNVVKDVEDSSYSWETVFSIYYNSSQWSQFFFHPAVQDDPQALNPNLAQIRGKIVVLQDFTSILNIRYGIPWGSFNKQDNYNLNTNWDLYSKWTDVKNQLTFAVNRANSAVGVINFLSGSGGAFPYFVASGKSSSGTNDPLLWTGLVSDTITGANQNKYPDFPRRSCVNFGITTDCSIYFDGTNDLTMQFLTNLNNSGTYARVGMIMADFPGPGLIDTVIAQNKAEQPKRFFGDFNGDGNSDILSYHGLDGNWYLGSLNSEKQLTWTLVNNSSGFGNISSDKFFTGDFTGSGKQEIMFYSIGDSNWWLGTVSASNQLTWTLVNNTSGFGNISADRFFTGDFTHSGKQQIMFYSVGDHNWWLGSFKSTGTLSWSLTGNTAGFGDLNINHSFFTGDFLGDGRTDVLFYYPGDGNWFLGSLNASGQLNWVKANNSSGFGNISGDLFFVAPFTQAGHDNITFYSVGDHNWWLGSFKSTGTLSWSLAGNTAGFGNLADGRPFWTGAFLNASTSQVMFYYPGDNNWWLGTVGNTGALTWNLATNTSSFGGNLADGRPLWVSPFNGGTQADVLVYSSTQGSWELGFIGSGNSISWYSAGNGGIQ